MRKQKLLKDSGCKSRLLALLLTVAASLLCSVIALATDFQATYYFDNTVTQWDHVYLIIGKSDWHQTIEMTEDADCQGIYKHTLNGWTDATKFFFAESTCGFTPGSGSGGIDDTPTCANYTVKITSKPSNFLFVPSSESGKNIEGTWNAFIPCCPTDVLNGTKIMCYGGEAKSWGQSTYYLKNTSTKENVASGTMSGTYSIGGTDFEFAPLTVAAGTYIHGHWDSGLQGAVAAGESYIVYSSVPFQYTKVSENGGNSLSKNNRGTTSISFSAATSISEGENLSISSMTAPGSTSIGTANSVKWFISEKDANVYSEYTLSEGKLNTSSLSAGNYTLKAVLTDNSIFVVGGTKDFAVTAPVPGDLPTVLLAGEPEVSGAIATLHGYLKYTGCKDVTDFGFVWSTKESEISTPTPTGTTAKATSPAAPITVAGTEFELADYVFSGGTEIYYKAYATNAQGTSYSSEYGHFTIEECDKPVVTAITIPDPICSSVGTINATATATGEGNTYLWEVDGTVFSEASGTGATATITVAAPGSGSISVTPTSGIGCTGDKFTLSDVAVKGYPVTISAEGAKGSAATYPWQVMTFTAETEAPTVTWDISYSGTIASDLTIWNASDKSATLKSGAPVSDTDHYTVTAKTNEEGCEVTSEGYNAYINDDAEEVCD